MDGENETDQLDAASETDASASQDTKTPASEAAQKDTSSAGSDQTPTDGETSAASTDSGKETGKEPMIPKSRLDQEIQKREVLTKRLKELEAVDSELATLGKRFGRGSREYLEELKRFYAEQDRRNPPTAEDRIAQLEQKLSEFDEQGRVREELQKIAQEMISVRDNPKYSALKGNWDRWQKVIIGAMSADLDRTADDCAQEIISLLESSKADYVKTKSEEGRRQIESGGGGTPPGRKEEKYTKLRDLDRMVETAVKGAKFSKAQSGE